MNQTRLSMRLLLLACLMMPAVVLGQAVRFEKQVLREDFVSEGIAAADVNGDGQLDLVAGAYWFEGPNWTARTYRPAQTYKPLEGYSDTFLQYADDVNLDGRDDIIRLGFPGTEGVWYENPGTPEADWPEHIISGSVCNEAPLYVDVNGDGRRDLVFAQESDGTMAWFRAAATPDEAPWTRIVIGGPDAPGTDRYAHGLGFGDINGDGRNDVIVREGWWEAPADPNESNWTFHEADLGEACANMFAYDVDGDGDNDVLSSSAHSYGIWWHEQVDDGSWRRHTIHDEFSQTHSLVLADVNGDGLDDLITGKRLFPHLGDDPGAHDPAVLYWFELQRTDDGPEWIPHEIDTDSGVGLSFVAEDFTGDGLLDIAVANKGGVFVFEQVRE